MQMPEQGYSLRLKKVRDLLGYSQRDLAEEFQVTNGAVAHWESGTRPIPGPISKLIEIYEVSLNHRKGCEGPQIDASCREIIGLIQEALHSEGYLIDEKSKTLIRASVEAFVKENFEKDLLAGRVQMAIARKLIRSTKGLLPWALKAAQMASNLEFAMPPEVPALLGHVASRKRPLPFRQIEEILKDSYKESFEKVFARVYPEPLSSNGFSQIHRAKLKTGDEVVLKIKRPVSDLSGEQVPRTSFFACLKELLSPVSEGVCKDIQLDVFGEADYEKEAHNQERFRNIFEHEPRIVIPRVYRELCQKNVIVSSFEFGDCFEDFCTKAKASEKSEAAQLISYFSTFSLYKWSLLYGDIHPGNFRFRNNQVVIFDFGRVIEFEQETAQRNRELQLSVMKRDRLAVFNNLKQRNFFVESESAVFEDLWVLLLRQYEPHLTQSFKITPSYLRTLYLERKSFGGRRGLQRDKSFLRINMVYLGLYGLFSKLEAEVSWRGPLFEILKEL